MQCDEWVMYGMMHCDGVMNGWCIGDALVVLWEWLNVWMKEWMYEWKNEWINECMSVGAM